MISDLYKSIKNSSFDYIAHTTIKYGGIATAIGGAICMDPKTAGAGAAAYAFTKVLEWTSPQIDSNYKSCIMDNSYTINQSSGDITLKL